MHHHLVDGLECLIKWHPTATVFSLTQALHPLMACPAYVESRSLVAVWRPRCFESIPGRIGIIESELFACLNNLLGLPISLTVLLAKMISQR